LPVLFTPYVKKDTLFTEDSSDDDSNNERKEDDIPLNLTEFDDENEDDDSGTFTQNGTNIAEMDKSYHMKAIADA
jgi:hypothetical protein